MSIYNSEQWIQDIDREFMYLEELNELSGTAVMITGAYGLICSAVVDILIRYNETHDEPIKILAAGINIEKLDRRFKPYCDKDYFEHIHYDALKDIKLKSPVDYIIHGAGNACPNMIMKEPVETMLSNFSGMYCLLNQTKEWGTKRVLYLSSSEVYGTKNEKFPYQENDYGYIDILNPRNSYSLSKKATETLCVSYAVEYGMEAVIVRPGHIYGPTASQEDNRVSSSFAFAAAQGKDIVLKSKGSQLRSYCYCLDCASAILKVLLRGENLCAYNISDPNSIISIRQMAELLSEAGGVKLVQGEAGMREKKGFNPMEASSLDSTKLLRLGWKSAFCAETGLSHTVKILKESLD